VTLAVGDESWISSLPLFLHMSWHFLSRLQHSEQIGPSWNGQPAMSGRSNEVVQTTHSRVTAES
jgi:hypothetical protein